MLLAAHPGDPNALDTIQNLGPARADPLFKVLWECNVIGYEKYCQLNTKASRVAPRDSELLKAITETLLQAKFPKKGRSIEIGPLSGCRVKLTGIRRRDLLLYGIYIKKCFFRG